MENRKLFEDSSNLLLIPPSAVGLDFIDAMRLTSLHRERARFSVFDDASMRRTTIRRHVLRTPPPHYASGYHWCSVRSPIFSSHI